MEVAMGFEGLQQHRMTIIGKMNSNETIDGARFSPSVVRMLLAMDSLFNFFFRVYVEQDMQPNQNA